MAQTMNYADILTQVMREEEKFQPSFVPVKIIRVCDQETGQFMLVAVGWEGQRHVDSILFHARLADGMVIIETDNTEEGLQTALTEAGIRAEDIVSGWKYGRPEAAQAAA